MDYTMNELLEWNERIESIAKANGLSYYPQEFDICDYDDMIGYETYVGMPSHYPHWSFGKAYDKTRTMHKLGMTGLPYEMVINSNPCLAYLMKDNTLLLQILTIAHVYGHNDFFKNNHMFTKATDANETFSMFKLHGDRIRRYIADPSIGYEKVEKMLNAAHALRYQVEKAIGIKKVTHADQKRSIADQINKLSKPSDNPLLFNRKELSEQTEISKLQSSICRVPIEPDEDILGFVLSNIALEDWQKDVLEIVRNETAYFIPQMETKVMNEGWASYWHYNILKELNMSTELHMEFLQKHNGVIRPHIGNINPYYVGFKIFEWMDKNLGRKAIFEAREMHRDSSFIRMFLNKELCEEMNLFEYTKKEDEYKVKYSISSVADELGWKNVRDSLANQVGMASIPTIRVIDYKPKENAIYIDHLLENGIELDLGYAKETIKYIFDLVGVRTVLFCTIDKKETMIVCDSNRNVTVN